MTERELHANLVPRLLAIVTDRDQNRRLEGILLEKRAYFHYMFNGMGTASSETLNTFGLSGTEKTVCLCIEPYLKIKPLMTAVVERLEFVKPGNGIAFVLPISSISMAVSSVLDTEFAKHKERWLQEMSQEKETEKPVGPARYELVLAVINQGFSEDVMTAARTAGVRGGTIIHARRSGIEDAVKFFGVSLQAEKEIVAILIHHSQKKELMQVVSTACGMRTEAHGIFISLPVESCAGIDMSRFEEEEQ